MPPSHAGMVPAALPAFSAPIGVSVVPSFARSAAESSARTGKVAAAMARTAQVFFDMWSLLVFVLLGGGLERIAHAHRIEVAVLERVGARAPAGRLPGRDARALRRLVGAAVGAPAEEARVLDIDEPAALIIPRQADGRGLGVLVEVRAHAVHVMRERDPRREVAAVEHVAVLQARCEAVAPRALREEALV